MKMLSVIVPVFNEVDTVCTLLDRLTRAPFPRRLESVEIVLVDDGSSDGTWERLSNYSLPERGDELPVRLALHRHDENRGKGAALRTGFALSKGEILLIQDADLEYSPDDYPVLLKPILDGIADVVYGSRFLGGPHRVLFFWHHVGNRLLTLLSNMCTDLNLTDMETCYKVFTRKVYERLTLVSNRFGFEPEFTAKVSKTGCRIYEVPIAYHGRTYQEGKKIGWKDGVSAIWCILRFNLFFRDKN
ncbi:MAG: glycosyltransferase family 2 protein [bacterium]|nr:glycosyltransferase family 2 protein [bacterium]